MESVFRQQQQPSHQEQGAGATPVATTRRRGRGTFNQPLRADQPSANNTKLTAVNDNASVLTAVTTTVLPASNPPPVSRVPEEDLAAEYGGHKRDIPLNIRENFGVCETEHEADTVRQLLFRGEKRRRYCIIVGELQNSARPITLKLFGHKGPKPFKLQNKLIRLVNISVGRPRPPRPVIEGVEGGEGEGEGEGEDAREDNSDADELKRGGSDELDMACYAGHESVQDEPEPTHDVYEEPTQHSDKEQERHGDEEQQRQPRLEGKEDASREDYDTRVRYTSQNYEDVDVYANEDNVLPLMVELRDSATTNMSQPSSMANSPVLTVTRFDGLQKYFFDEFTHLLSLEDVRMQHVSINLNLGAAYCCLAREGSYSTPLKYATFSEFVQRMNEESMQLYFMKDAPTCVSRAVDRECGALQSEAVFSLVKICFFSNERQSRSVARAMWDAYENRFVLLDMENAGVTFTWTVFSVDETGIAAAPMGPSPQDVGNLSTVGVDGNGSGGGDGGGAGTGPDGNGAMRKKTVAFPFELEFHVYRRWKQHTEHPAAPIAEAILDKLSLAEHNLIHYGSTIGYESMDLSHVCEVDAESEDFNVESIIVEHTSRVKPRGTDLTVDSTSSLWIENFAAARALKNRLAQGNISATTVPQAVRERPRGREGRGPATPHVPKQKTLHPASRLTFFRARSSTVHWKLRPSCSTEENLAPLSEALHFARQVINTANEIERTSVRGGAAPDAI
ncbi:hypothetical protein TraAM80_03800 [Trypanosoma rangeli]|uniref:Uncharacterized protein n=1 Tax=Trypanosoma rangeli TaxID=5698 RepID=A0A3R7L3I6_TRYRA|nr:uncharacterized protein TraAM80_03800 [Trypanosoma rangeli]RNF06855.1 hypothetical protein TraAM80_03800 [Trypanosoma rangeli]|eukprot:RNF06855.1 hypothetical protein TraAM80_03800 [Trypanosoma rangeli]